MKTVKIEMELRTLTKKCLVEDAIFNRTWPHLIKLDIKGINSLSI